MTQQSPIRETTQQIRETENTVFIEDKKDESIPIPAQPEKNTNPEEQEKKETEVEVKKSLQDEDIPVEPVLGNDGIEVGGEG